MRWKSLVLGLALWSLGTVAVRACPSGNPNSLDYIRRDNNRCEGIRSNSLVSGSLRLISFAIRDTDTYGDTVTLRVPRVAGAAEPKVTVQALRDRYQLDEFDLEPGTNAYRFNWSSYVLREASIAPRNLRLRASTRASVVYVPVVLGEGAPQYEIVFYTSGDARFDRFQIRCNGETVYSTSRSSFRSGEIVFTWNGRNTTGQMQPAGRCELDYEVRLQPLNRTIDRTVAFYHVPNWLR